MQDIRSLGGGGDRRLNPNHHRGSGDGFGGFHRDSLNCPRCNSLNTKFCYYNNYNLSQPRFFCKGCRRYWTKGGVLRNVPVGGGVRKPKRSKQKSGNGNPSSVAVATTCERKSSDSHNSTTPLTLTVTEVATTSFNFQESCFDPPMLDHHNFSEMGESLMTSSSDQLTLGSEISSFMQQQDEHEIVENQNLNRQQWVQETGEINDGVAAEDWGLFDQSYWWNSHDHQLNYFP